jgi:TonB family protein
MPDGSTNLYSATEIARAAGLAEERVRQALGARALVTHQEALRIARSLMDAPVDDPPAPPVDETLFTIFSMPAPAASRKGLPLAVSGTAHGLAVLVGLLLTMVSVEPTSTTLASTSPEPMRLVFMVTPGKGGGGGGGGRLEKATPPKALREGPQIVSSPLPQRQPPPSPTPAPEPPPTPPPLNAEPLSAVLAPIVTSPADRQDRIGILQEARNDNASHGPGRGGGAGDGKGTGLGEGDGAGIGPGSGGGIGGGPYRGGSGIDPPRLLTEVKPDYTDEARRKGVKGEVVMEIVVRADGTVGETKILKGLPAGLNERAVQAVRRWRFAPARLRGTAVDVVVEVAVEFQMR